MVSFHHLYLGVSFFFRLVDNTAALSLSSDVSQPTQTKNTRGTKKNENIFTWWFTGFCCCCCCSIVSLREHNCRHFLSQSISVFVYECFCVCVCVKNISLHVSLLEHGVVFSGAPKGNSSMVVHRCHEPYYLLVVCRKKEWKTSTYQPPYHTIANVNKEWWWHKGCRNL